MTVTRDELDVLRSRLKTPEPALVLRPEGWMVQQTQQAHFNYQLKQLQTGEKSLADAQEKLRAELEDVRSRGQHRAQFNVMNHTNACNLKL
ncbi:MAG: hypothetical protein ACFHVJ_10890 [Aestuariibacter sp.]